MPTIPNPAMLVENAHSAGRNIVDPEWKKYQRYLRKYRAQYGNFPDQPTLKFEDFCDMLRKNGEKPPDTQN